MVDLLLLALVAVSAGLGSIVTVWVLDYRRRPTHPVTTVDKIKEFFNPTPVEPPRDYPVQSMPRTAGPWRRQKRELEAQHNTKQKERDAMTRPQEKKPNAKTR